MPALYTTDTLPALYTTDTLPALYTTDTLPALYTTDTLPALYTTDTLPALYSGRLRLLNIYTLVDKRTGGIFFSSFERVKFGQGT